MDLTIGIITYNEEERIEKCLKSCLKLHNNILIIDDFSTDKTIQICKQYKCKLIKNKFLNFSQQRNFLVENCNTYWLLMIDSDETLTQELVDNIKQTIKNPIYNSYKMKRNNYFNNCILRMYSPDYQHRFFNKKACLKCKGIVHNKFFVKGDIGKLSGFLNHYSYKNIEHYINKIIIQSKKKAQMKLQNGEYYNFCYLFLKCIITFIKFYIIKLGFLDGIYGLIFVNGHIMYDILTWYFVYINYKI